MYKCSVAIFCLNEARRGYARKVVTYPQSASFLSLYMESFYSSMSSPQLPESSYNGDPSNA